MFRTSRRLVNETGNISDLVKKLLEVGLVSIKAQQKREELRYFKDLISRLFL